MATQPIPTPTPVDMFGPDGQVHSVNQGDVQAALASGGEFAHQLKAPDGQIHYVRHSQLGYALKAGGVPVAALEQQTTQPQPSSALSRFVSSAKETSPIPLTTDPQRLKDFANTVVSRIAANPAAGPISALIPSATESQQAITSIAPKVGQEAVSTVQAARAGDIPAALGHGAGTLGYTAATALSPFGGGTLAKAGEQIGSGDVAGGLGTTTGLLAQILAAKAISNKTTPQPATLPEAAKTITDAVNPPPKSMTTFQNSVQEHLPKAIQAAREQGLPLSGRADLAQAFTAAAEKAKGTYYNDMLGPVKDQAIDTSGIRGYQGATSYYNTATLGQLDARLSEINSTLAPSYEKGGASARAAISAESKSALTAEAAAIRSRLYQEISNRTGIDQDAIASTKSSMGSMYNIADKITTALNKERFAANQAAQGQNLPATAQAAVIRGVNKGYRSVFNNPDKRVANTVSAVGP